MDETNYRIEHVALQVADPIASARWLVDHLKMRIVRQIGEPTYTTFLVDAAGHSMIEIYRNPKVSVPDYRRMHHLHLHLAFVVDNIATEITRLCKAKATIAEDVQTTPAGDVVVMLRDPWGLPIQLVKRKKRMP